MGLGKRLAIDLGTANCIVWEIGKGIILEEPTVVALSVEEQKVIAVGEEAKQMLGKTPDFLTACRPMREGVIADYEVTRAMLSYFIQKACGRGLFFKPEVMICTPAGVTQVEQRAVLEATYAAGARRAWLITEPLAAAIGARLPVAEPFGNMIVDLGGGSTEAAVICLGGVVVHESVRVAGNKLDEAIAQWLRTEHKLLIGEQTAEAVKIKIGAALPPAKEEVVTVKGRDALYGLPKTVRISSTEVAAALKQPLEEIAKALKRVLEKTPPELVADVIERGVVLSGGTALLRNLDRYLTEKLGVACRVADEPMYCVIKGTAAALENLTEYQRAIKGK